MLLKKESFFFLKKKKRKTENGFDVFSIAGPKDLPKIARTAGRLAGRSIGYVQLARGQFDNVMQQSQARQVVLLFGLTITS